MVKRDWEFPQGLEERLDAERRLVLAYVGARRRPAVAALWTLDAVLGAVVSAGTQPMIGQVKLAWWRQALEGLDRRNVPAEPVLARLAGNVLPAGVSGIELAEMTVGWEHLVSAEQLKEEDIAGFARFRGGLLFRYSARLLGAEPTEQVERAGEGWALADLARRVSSADEAKAASTAAGERLFVEGVWPRPARPLGMLAMLARRDMKRGPNRLEPLGAPGRILRMLSHRLTGR